jgi:soluble lytic murein transglycosylase-like protein
MGLTQLMPGTASSLGVSNAMNPAEAIEGGARYLSQLMGEFGGNTSEALAAYNAGPGAVKQYGGIPPYAETQSYVTKVLGYAEAFRQSHPASSTGGVA